MGAGKSSVGRRLAKSLAIPFADADTEIEAAAGMTVKEIFEKLGEAEFRRGERQVIARLLKNKPHVLATGGGAFMDSETRELIKDKAISIWLKADLDLLMERVSRRDTRPLLDTADPRQVMEDLIAQRHPVYETADITVNSVDGPHEVVVDAIISSLNAYLTEQDSK